MATSTVVVGAYDDTLPTYQLTITRDPADSLTDWTTATAVELVLPDGTTRAVTKVSATEAEWVGTITYGGWFTSKGAYQTYTRVTFPDGGRMTLADSQAFIVRH